MGHNRRPLLLVLAVLILAVGGFVVWKYVLRGGPPTLERDGGTVLVYEVEEDSLPEEFDLQQMGAAIRRRIDPSGRLNITVNAVAKDRIEILLPEFGVVRSKNVQDVKELLARVGTLEFRMVANGRDDAAAFQAAEAFLARAVKDWEKLIAEVAEKHPAPRADQYDGIHFCDIHEVITRAEVAGADTKGLDLFVVLTDSLNRRPELRDLWRTSRSALPPPPLRDKEGETFPVAHLNGEKARYQWASLGKAEMQALKLDDTNGENWKKAAEARRRGQAYRAEGFDFLVFSRMVRVAAGRPPRIDYFVLTRRPASGKEVTGALLSEVKEAVDGREKPAVDFRFNQEGGEQFHELTSRNVSSPDTQRYLAMILDGEVLSAPSIREAIRDVGQITGQFSEEEVDRLVGILRSGALPAKLKAKPVSEVTFGRQK